LFEVIIIRRRLSGMPSSVLGRRTALTPVIAHYARVHLIMRSFSDAVPRDALTVSPDCYVRRSGRFVKKLRYASHTNEPEKSSAPSRNNRIRAQLKQYLRTVQLLNRSICANWKPLFQRVNLNLNRL